MIDEDTGAYWFAMTMLAATLIVGVVIIKVLIKIHVI